jgi:hypothetical protein
MSMGPDRDCGSEQTHDEFPGTNKQQDSVESGYELLRTKTCGSVDSANRHFIL